MPQTQRGQAYKLNSGKWGLRYYDAQGNRRRKSPFPSKSAALAHYRDLIEPRLLGQPTEQSDLTLGEFVPIYLERHGAVVRGRTIAILRERLGYAVRAYGDVPLSDLERMSGELASWIAALSEGSRYGIVQALRQALEAAVRWGNMQRNPAKLAGPNRQPAPRTVRAFTPSELDAIAAELPPRYMPLPAFAAATGLRPEEWAALERRDIDRGAGHLSVRRTVSEDGSARKILIELAKTSASRRQVPDDRTPLRHAARRRRRQHRQSPERLRRRRGARLSAQRAVGHRPQAPSTMLFSPASIRGLGHYRATVKRRPVVGLPWIRPRAGILSSTPSRIRTGDLLRERQAS